MLFVLGAHPNTLKVFPLKDFNQLSTEFKNDYQATQNSILEFKQAKAYYHGNQLPADVLNIITERGQTPIVENIYKMIINKILGYKIQSIQEVRLTPRQEENKPPIPKTILSPILSKCSSTPLRSLPPLLKPN